MQNLIVLHFLDGRITKGVTSDFSPAKAIFHLLEKETRQTTKVYIAQLKAVFFVKSLEGNKDYQERQDIERTGLGKKIMVRFKDGETLIGYTAGYTPNRTGFFLFPSDPSSNNDRIFIVHAATAEITFV